MENCGYTLRAASHRSRASRNQAGPHKKEFGLGFHNENYTSVLFPRHAVRTARSASPLPARLALSGSCAAHVNFTRLAGFPMPVHVPARHEPVRFAVESEPKRGPEYFVFRGEVKRKGLCCC